MVETCAPTRNFPPCGDLRKRALLTASRLADEGRVLEPIAERGHGQTALAEGSRSGSSPPLLTRPTRSTLRWAATVLDTYVHAVRAGSTSVAGSRRSFAPTTSSRLRAVSANAPPDRVAATGGDLPDRGLRVHTLSNRGGRSAGATTTTGASCSGRRTVGCGSNKLAIELEELQTAITDTKHDRRLLTRLVGPPIGQEFALARRIPGSPQLYATMTTNSILR